MQKARRRTQYKARITALKVRDMFSTLSQKAMKQFLDDKINERLKSALSGGARPPASTSMPSAAPQENESPEDALNSDGIVTTVEELEGFNIVRAIVRSEVDVKRVVARDTKSYFGVLLDDNNRKPICRLHFNRSQKYIGIFDENKVETRHQISEIDDIFSFSDALKTTVRQYGA